MFRFGGFGVWGCVSVWQKGGRAVAGVEKHSGIQGPFFHLGRATQVYGLRNESFWRVGWLLDLSPPMHGLLLWRQS